jgi:signal transduction histidine kinase
MKKKENFFKKAFPKIKDFFYSIRVQMILVFIAVGLIPIFVLFNIFTSTYNKHLIDQRTEEIKSYGTIISNLIMSSNYLTTHDSDSVESEISEVAKIYQGRILVVDQSLKIIKDTYDLEDNKFCITSEVIKCFSDPKAVFINDLSNYIQITMPIVSPDTGTVNGALLMSFSEKNFDLISKSVINNSRLIILIIIIAVLLFAVLYSLSITMPLKNLTKTINEVKNGSMTVHVKKGGYNEINGIADSFNDMIDVIHDQENVQSQFASNVSHELKTPLASIKVLSDSLLADPDAPADMYKEFMGDINSEVDRMTNIVNDLLQMVKLDKNTAKMQIATCNINKIIEDMLKRFRPIAGKRKIELIYESMRQVDADVDEVKLTSAINNLISNSIKYNYDSGWVKITLNADHRFFYITVQDSGVGIPEDEQDKIFDRFYRVDKARSRATGGTGLGLSITRNVVLLHRGSIKVYSKPKQGTTFSIRIPLTYAVPSEQ